MTNILTLSAENSAFVQFTTMIKPLIPGLSDSQKQTLRSALEHACNKRDLWHIREWLLDPVKWRCPRVSLDTFLDDRMYLGIGKTVFPMVRKICREVLEGGYLEGVEVAGIGSGKSFSSSILACYEAHTLLCMRNPHETYNLTKDKPITIMNMGTTATQALDVVFASIRGFIATSEWFQGFAPQMLTGSIEFMNEKVMLMSGNSKSTTPLGYNIFCAVLDEAAFYMDNEQKSIAEEIYNALQRRIVSRFGNDGLLMMISSPRYVGDFIMRKLEQSKELDENGLKKYPHLYAVQAPIWKFKGISRYMTPETFFFNCRENVIIDTAQMSEADIAKNYSVNYVEDENFDDSYHVWEVPKEYLASFRQNPELAKRDYGSVPSLTLEGFFPNAGVITSAWNRARRSPVIKPGTFKFAERALRTSYFIHIDIGFNREGKGDHTGFAMGHFGGWQEDEATGEKRMIFVIDVYEQIGYDLATGEVDLSKVRQRIYDIRDMGYPINRVTLDGYMSKDFMQILRKKGIRAEYLSVDKTVEPYNALKAAFMEKRIDIYHSDVLERELIQLELIKGVKVDHPENGSKDVSDAVAGVCFSIQEYTSTGELGMMSSASFGKKNQALKQHEAQIASEQVIRRKEEILRMRQEAEERLGLN